METEAKFLPLEWMIKVEPEQFEDVVLAKPNEICTEAKNFLETESVFVKIEDTETTTEDSIIKLEPQASLKPVVVLKRLNKTTISRWTERKQAVITDKLTKPKLNLKCDICGKSSPNRFALRLHLELHFKTPHMFCDLCPREFRDKNNLRIHMRSHLQDKPFACKKCSFETIYKYSLTLHNNIHQKLTECPKCHKMVTVMKTHLRRTHARKDRQVQCETCGKTMVKDKLARHINMVHAANRPCPKCNEKFSTRGLKIHTLKAHYKGKLYECQKCDAVFKSSNTFRSHNKSHCDGITCKVCGLKYSSEFSLSRHWKDKHSATFGSFTVWKKKNQKSELDESS